MLVLISLLSFIVIFDYLTSLQLSRVSQCISLCLMAQWMTLCHIWFDGLRRTTLCCKGSVKRETSWGKSYVVESGRRLLDPNREREKEKQQIRKDKGLHYECGLLEVMTATCRCLTSGVLWSTYGKLKGI